jgi:MoaA/NifB/PqqE/SkfB family radical SAM enzyme
MLARDPALNLAIGPMCPVRCEGCYNHFGGPAGGPGLITAAEVIAFAAAARAEGVGQATLSGGDPLFHPEFTAIAAGLSGLGLHVKVDTVGTALIGPARIVYKGRGRAARVDVADLAPHVRFVAVPLDGARQETVEAFRRGRANLFAETRTVAGLLRGAGIPFGYNTVASTANLAELPAIGALAAQDGAAEWQVFEYDPAGPNPSARRPQLRLAPGQFTAATAGLQAGPGVRVACKSLDDRSGAYFLVDDSGRAWKPAGEGLRRVFGHITADRPAVMAALARHVADVRAAA